MTAPDYLEITALSHDGRGIGRDEGRAIFVHGALPGEKVRIERLKKRKGVLQADLLEVLEAAPERVEPKCAHFGVCGGCALQHLDPQSQLAAKQQTLLDNFQRLGQVTPERVLPPLEGPLWNYRRRARLGVKWVRKKGRVLVGFRERQAPFVADVRRCEVLAEPVGSLIEPLGELIGGLSILDRLPQIEVAVADNQVALVLRVLSEPTADDRDRLRAFAAENGVSFYLQPGNLDTVAPLDPATPEPEYALPEFDLNLAFRPVDFIQINAEINRRMLEQALHLLELNGDESVLDLFCGLGNFTLPLARRAGRVTGVEGDTALVARADGNARRNGLDNADFHLANLFEDNADLPWARGQYDAVLLDPPRAGAREVLPIVDRSGASRVVYVSCHPATLARDAGHLVRDHGFRLEAAGVLDMFPHTAHVESMALFTR